MVKGWPHLGGVTFLLSASLKSQGESEPSKTASHALTYVSSVPQMYTDPSLARPQRPNKLVQQLQSSLVNSVFSMSTATTGFLNIKGFRFSLDSWLLPLSVCSQVPITRLWKQEQHLKVQAVEDIPSSVLVAASMDRC